MRIDPQTNAERQAASTNRTQAQRYPLLHHAGIVDQLVERWAAECQVAQAFASTGLLPPGMP